MTNALREPMAWSGKRLHWFNPENDLALATGLSNYTPPKAARMISGAGEALPIWYGNEGDIVECCPDEKWLEKVTRDFTPSTTPMSSPVQESITPCPWGWSAYARRHFEMLGVDVSTLLSADMIDSMRRLSHRRTAAALADELKSLLPDIRLADAAVECRTPDEVKAFMTAHPAAYLKSPWSSSGRGVIATSALTADRVMKFAADSIRHQGSVMAERAYDKTVDFAMLFECRGGLAMQRGTSVFLTDARGAYTGNLLAPEAERLATLTRHHIAPSTLESVRKALTELLTRHIAPCYNGILGVDMLVASDGTLDACVELNLRTTMGYVANAFADRYLHPEARGMMRSGMSTVTQQYTAEGGRLTAGTLHLSPPSGGFAFSAEITTRCP
ncbi:MAG: hypothetical protein K2K05_10725 [Muribaculaceae bacterium]|nr:hypothetical protein [Muribaculaceae bacterium]